MTPDVPTLPPLADILGHTHVVQLTLVTPFRGLRHRQALLLRGPAGWAEFNPFTEYDDAEASHWLAAALEIAWHGYPHPVRTQIELNATVPAVTAADVPTVLARFPGATTAKIKVAETGQTLADDLARVRAVREHLGEAAHLRIDANTGWTLNQAREALETLAPYNLQYAEQPVATLTDLATLTADMRRHGGPKIAADEAIRKALDPIAVANAQAADIAVVKMPPLGGPTRARQIAHYLAAHGLDIVFSSALDTGIGLAAGLATAAAIPDLPYANGLGTWRLFTEHICPPPPTTGNTVTIPTTPVIPDPELLDRHAANPETTTWWRDRLTRCYHHLHNHPLPKIPTP